MAKKKSTLSTFFTTNPLTVGSTILLVMSVLINIGTLFFIVLINNSSHFDLSLLEYTQNKICSRDYTEVVSMLNKDAQADSQSVANLDKFFAASTCWRDYTTGKSLDLNSVKPLAN